MVDNKRNYDHRTRMTGVKKNAVVFFGLFLVGMLFGPTGIPFMVPEAEAAHEVPHPITDLSQPVPSGTVIEYDLNWNAFSPSGWYVLTIFIDNYNPISS